MIRKFPRQVTRHFVRTALRTALKPVKKASQAPAAAWEDEECTRFRPAAGCHSTRHGQAGTATRVWARQNLAGLLGWPQLRTTPSKTRWEVGQQAAGEAVVQHGRHGGSSNISMT